MIADEKIKVVNEYKETINNVNAILLIGFKGITVKQLNEIRKKLRENHAFVKIIKNSLLRRIFKDTNKEILLSSIEGETAIVYTKNDPIILAKNIVDFKQSYEKLEVKGGCVYGKAITFEELKILQTLPSLEILRAKLISILINKVQEFLALLNTPLWNFLGVIEEKKKQLS